MAIKNVTVNNCEFNIHFMDAKFPNAIAVSYHPKGPELREESEAIFHLNQHRLIKEVEGVVQQHPEYYSQFILHKDFDQDDLVQMEPKHEGNRTNTVTKSISFDLKEDTAKDDYLVN